jgi:23S rRNA (guanosine2251-2'-O)-methyltransferase
MAMGLHAVESLLKHRAERIENCFALRDRRSDPRLKLVISRIEAHQIPVQWISREELAQLAHSEHHQGILVRLKEQKAQDLNALLQLVETLHAPRILALDGVQDPHNLGACIRSAAAAGFHGVMVPKDRAVGLTATVLKVASGGAEQIPFFQVTNLARSLQALKKQNLWVVGLAAAHSQSLYDLQLPPGLVLLLGSEADGIRPLVAAQCDYQAHIPMAGGMESLNVSVAAGIAMFEIQRQLGTLSQALEP